MPVFEYKALNKKGKSITGIIDAKSPYTARQKLRNSDMYPVSVEKLNDGSTKHVKKSRSFNRLFQRVSQREITVATRQLAALTSAKFPLIQAMEAVTDQTASYYFKTVLARVKENVEEGMGLSGALSMYPDLFSPIYVNMVLAGENSGTLDIVLNRLADMLEKKKALTGKIQSAVTYPVFMAIIGLVVVVFLVMYIVPGITGIFSDMGKVLPLPTRLLLGTSGFIEKYFWVMCAIAALFSILSYKILKTKKGRKIKDNFLFSIPYFGELLKKVQVSLFSKTMASLLENGVPLLTALDIVKNMSPNVTFKKAVETAIVEVERGGSLGKVLSGENVFPKISAQMIHIGEQSADLSGMFYKISDMFDNEIESALVRLTSLIEPVLILLMGLVMGFIVVSICLPIFEMNRLVQ